MVKNRAKYWCWVCYRPTVHIDYDGKLYTCIYCNTSTDLPANAKVTINV